MKAFASLLPWGLHSSIRFLSRGDVGRFCCTSCNVVINIGRIGSGRIFSTIGGRSSARIRVVLMALVVVVSLTIVVAIVIVVILFKAHLHIRER